MFDVFDSDIVYECDLFGVNFQDLDMQLTVYSRVQPKNFVVHEYFAVFARHADGVHFETANVVYDLLVGRRNRFRDGLDTGRRRGRGCFPD